MTELQIQKTCAEYLDRHPKTRGCWAHPPNGGQRTRKGGGSLKAQGVKPGLPDILIFRPPEGALGLAIELKTKKGILRINKDPHEQAKNDFLAVAHEHAPDTPLSGPLLVWIKCVFPRPKKHYFTGARSGVLRPDAPTFAASKSHDFDNLAKFICDSLNHIFYEDDGLIVFGGPVLKMYGVVPRTEFYLREIDEATLEGLTDTSPMEQIILKILDKPAAGDRKREDVQRIQPLFR